MQSFPEIKRPFIIAELHPQHSGSLTDTRRMMLQAQLGGADAVKVQLYDTQQLHGNMLRHYIQMSKEELQELKQYADHLGIMLFASVFDKERLAWCEELDFPVHKIASRTVADEALCREIITIGKPTFISLGMYDWQTQERPYLGEHLTYFFCVAQYPTFLEDVAMPFFGEDQYFQGYSDHTIGIGACLYAVSRGAQYLEKHFTLNKARQRSTEKAHAGAMDFAELCQLRRLADDIAALRGQSL